MSEESKKWYKKWWIWVIILLLIGYLVPDDSSNNSSNDKNGFVGHYVYTGSDVKYEINANGDTFYGGATDMLGQTILSYDGTITKGHMEYRLNFNNPNITGKINSDMAIIWIETPIETVDITLFKN